MSGSVLEMNKRKLRGHIGDDECEWKCEYM